MTMSWRAFTTLLSVTTLESWPLTKMGFRSLSTTSWRTSHAALRALPGE